MERRRLIGIALVAVSACGFGSGAIFAKPVYAAGVDWLTLMAWRFLFGATLAWGWLLLSGIRRDALRRMTRRAVAVALALGALYVGNSGTYFAGIETVPASLAALIVYVYPALVAVLTLRYGRRLSGRRAWAALGLALVGVALALGGIEPGAAPPLTGLALVVASPVIYAVWIVLSARLSGERTDRVGHGSQVEADASPATALMMTATAAVYWTVALAADRPVLPAEIPASAWTGMLGVGVLATFVAIQTFYAGTRRMGAAQASLVSTIEPIWTIALAALMLNESLEPVQLAGGALILVGVLLAQTAPTADAEAERAIHPRLRLADE